MKNKFSLKDLDILNSLILDSICSKYWINNNGLSIARVCWEKESNDDFLYRINSFLHIEGIKNIKYSLSINKKMFFSILYIKYENNKLIFQTNVGVIEMEISDDCTFYLEDKFIQWITSEKTLYSTSN